MKNQPTPPSPFPRALPVIVMLRNRRFATVEQMVSDRPPFFLLGRQGTDNPPAHVAGEQACFIHTDRAHELWRLNGCWSEDQRPHPLDIVGVVTSNAGEKIELAPFAYAAGAKGSAA